MAQKANLDDTRCIRIARWYRSHRGKTNANQVHAINGVAPDTVIAIALHAVRFCCSIARKSSLLFLDLPPSS